MNLAVAAGPITFNKSVSGKEILLPAHLGWYLTYSTSSSLLFATGAQYVLRLYKNELCPTD